MTPLNKPSSTLKNRKNMEELILITTALSTTTLLSQLHQSMQGEYQHFNGLIFLNCILHFVHDLENEYLIYNFAYLGIRVRCAYSYASVATSVGGASVNSMWRERLDIARVRKVESVITNTFVLLDGPLKKLIWKHAFLMFSQITIKC